MRNIFISITFLLCTGVNLLFAQNLSYSSAIPVNQLRIDLDGSMGGNVSDMLSDLEYIPLETINKHIMKGVSNMTAIADGHIGIFNKVNSKPFLHIYALDGTLSKVVDIFRLSKLPTSEDIYQLKVWDNSFVLVSENYTINISTNGTDFSLTKRKDFAFIDSARIGESIWRYSIYDTSAAVKNALTVNSIPLITYSSPTNEYYIRKSSYFSPLCVSGNVRYFSPDNHFNIFELNATEITKIYDFIFPQKSIIDTSVNHKSYKEFFEYLSNTSGYLV